MKNNLILAACVAILFVGSSCSTINNTATTASVDTQIYNLTVADLKVAPDKASSTTSWSWNPFNQVNLDLEKKNASAKILQETGSDVLVEPQFEVHRRGIFRGGSLTVTGYPAKYSNFRAMSREDAENIAIANGNLTVASTTAAPAVTNANDIIPGILNGVAVNALSHDKKKKLPVVGTRRKKKAEYNRFVSILGGTTVSGGVDMDCSGNIGLMYGNHGNRWGFYVKGTVYWDGVDNDYEDRKRTSGYATIGLIKTLPAGFNLMAGVGFGGAVGVDYVPNDYDGDFGVNPAIPIEMMLQWNYKQFNVIGGVTYMPILSGFDCTDNPLNLSIGIGLNF